MLKGEIEILVRDAETGDVVDRIIQPNIVTGRAFEILMSNTANAAYIQGKIVATSVACAPSRSFKIIPPNLSGTQSVVGTAIPGNGNPDFFPRNLPTAAFAQWSTRLGLPVSTRTVSTVILTDTLVSQSFLDVPTGPGPYTYQVYAYSRLNTPCIQTTTQFLDIYYRVFFPDTNEHDMPYWAYENGVKRMVGDPSFTDFRLYQVIKSTALPPVTPNAGDEEIVWPSWTAVKSPGIFTLMTTSQLINPSLYTKKKYAQSIGLTDSVPSLMGTLHILSGDQRLVTASAAVANPQKIQNLLGHRSSSTKTFLDIDNLQQGTGSITLTGTWNNRGTPSSPGLYAAGLFPEMKFIRVSGSGGVGVAGYTYSTRPFFGVFNYGTTTFVNAWRTPIAWLPYISQGRTAPELNTNLLGDLSKFGVKQLSACCKYDDTSVVIVKQDQIILYNIATGTYWRYTAAYTNICQVAVVSGKIYVGCRDTGLWMIDPPNSATVTSLASPGSGIDLSKCYGVAKGASNNLLAAGDNCLARFDGVTWTRYASDTVPAFSIAGISDANYANIEYLVVDEESANFNLLAVRRYDAPVNPTSLGVWWSTTTAALDAGTNPIGTTQEGNPRLNRGHVGGRNGIWLSFWGGQYRLLTFNSTTITAVSLATAEPYFTNATAWLQAIMFTKNASNVTRWLSLSNSGVITESVGGSDLLTRTTAKLIDGTATVTESVQSSMSFYTGSGATDHASPSHSGICNTAAFDMNICFELQDGVIFAMGYEADSVRAYVGVYPFDVTHGGGALAYKGQKNYGWNGSSWTTSVATPKATHAGAEALADGVTVAFTNGVSGTSFVDTDFYNFTCAEGLVKDTATTATFEHSFYYKKAYRDQTLLSSPTIPATASTLGTGIVGLDTLRSQPTTGITMSSNRFVFPGQNPQLVACGDKQVTGEFEVEYTPFNDPLGQNICFGIGHASSGQMLYGFVIKANVINVYLAGDDTNGPFMGATTPGTYGTFSTATSLKLKRVANTLQFIVNGSVINSTTLGASRLRFDLIASPWSEYIQTTWLTGRITPATTILANGSDNAVRVGTLISSTGSYNPLFYAVDTDSRGMLTVLINGVEALAYRVAGEAVGAGEVGVDPYMGTLHFNPADEGDTVSATYTYITHE